MKLLDLENVNCSLVGHVPAVNRAACILSFSIIALQSIHSHTGLQALLALTAPPFPAHRIQRKSRDQNGERITG